MTGMSTPLPLVAVVAMARNRVIGDGERLLWHLPDDLKRVKALTMGKPVIMGRKTYLSIGRPLPGRANIILTRQRDFTADGILVAHDEDEALSMAEDWINDDPGRGREIIIFGGGEIYAAYLDRLARIELTEVGLAPEGGVRFPEIVPGQWREAAREEFPAQGGVPGYAYVVLVRRD